MRAPPGGDRDSNVPTLRARVAFVGPGAQIAEGELVPAAITLEVARLLSMSVSLGAFTVREGRAHFLRAVDVVGLTAVVAGIGVARLAIRKAEPILRATAEKIRST